MPHLFRTRDGTEWKPSHPVPLTLADGTKVEGIWAGSAQVEKLRWWLSKPGHDLAQTEEVAAIAVRGETTNKVLWSDAPAGVRVFFVLEAPTVGKNGNRYRLAKMVTTAATPAQSAYFDDERFSLFGTFNPDGTIAKIPPLEPPLSCTPQDDLFCSSQLASPAERAMLRVAENVRAESAVSGWPVVEWKDKSSPEES